MTSMTIKISLRTKSLAGKRQSLYLDYYPAIIHPETNQMTRREFLGLYIDNSDPANFTINSKNTETIKVAEKIRALRNEQWNNSNLDISLKDAIPQKINQLFSNYLYEYPDSTRKGRPFGTKNKENPGNKRKSLRELQIKEFLTINEVCELLSVSRWTVHRAIKQKELPAGKIGRTVLIKHADLNKLFQR